MGSIMRRTLSFVLLATAVATLGGCQQVAWKPGASAADLDRDTAACKAQYADREAANECLRKRGWVLRLPKAEAEEVAEDETAEAMPATAGAAAPAATPLPAAAPASGAVQAAPAASEPRSGTAAAPRNKSVPKPVDPLKPVTIQAWWKMGGQAVALTADTDACVATLGPRHQPDLTKRLYTRALVDCLKGKGWYGQ
jgi:hypothetical protein